MKNLNYIDLFAGAGGLSEGFIRNGFIPIAHVEKDPSACLTLKTRLAFHYLREINKLDVYYNYLKGNIARRELYLSVPSNILDSVINSEICKKENTQIFQKIDKLKGDQPIDLIIGGPPCQAYSYVGRPALKHKQDDKRKLLYLDYAKFLVRYKPKMFIFENVPGIYTSENGKYYKNLRRYFKRIGYTLEDKVLNASNFGVIQKRNRVIIIGWRREYKFSYPLFETIENIWKVKDIFYDLPILSPGEVVHVAPYREKRNDYLEKYNIRNGLDFVSQNFARFHNARDLKIYSLAIEQLLLENKRLKNDQIPPEDRTQKNITSFLDRFKVVNENDLSHTLIAHIAKDGHYYIHPDLLQLRSISVREAARIQSFPDDYYFEGIKEGQVRSAAFRQIGNAVPPLMAFAIAKEIQKLLNEI